METMGVDFRAVSEVESIEICCWNLGRHSTVPQVNVLFQRIQIDLS